MIKTWSDLKEKSDLNSNDFEKISNRIKTFYNKNEKSYLKLSDIFTEKLEKTRKMDNKNFPEILNKFLNDDMQIENKKVEKETLKKFIDIKFGIDVLLIEEIKKDLNKKFECHFVSNKQKTDKSQADVDENYFSIKYPKLFYALNGHFLEEIIQKIFFQTEYKKSKLIDEIVGDNGLIKKCGYLVPIELKEIFDKIDDPEAAR